MELENMLAKHILDLEKNLFGLITCNVRQFAFDIAEKQHISQKFNKNRKIAGKAWFYALKNGHPELTVKQPKSTYLNKVKEKIIDENDLTPVRIFNVDESGFCTVQKNPQKIVNNLEGKKQVGAITSGERGANSTTVCCANAAGHFVLPILIFKRMR
ncbi:unnamed protein product [Hermetia illucens]|uniref:Transposase n=1 Tax=Hermetia illucens TaxID=343691 RepID=A0A7R8V250_HERIL|nr:unnamed protein product [Hermetia illucens]